MKLIAIGIVHSKYKQQGDAPFQGRHANDECTLEVFVEYEPALQDTEKCSHLIVLYWMGKAKRTTLQTRTPWGPEIHGVFATRSPNRPNPVGICVVELLACSGRFLRVRGMDAWTAHRSWTSSPIPLKWIQLRRRGLGGSRRGISLR